MSAVKKGNQYEIEAKKTLEKEGWIVFRQHRKPLYMNGKIIMVGADIFGCDIVASRPGHRKLWIQVSTRAQKSTKIKQVVAYPWNYEHERVEIWLRAEGKKQFAICPGPTFEESEVRPVAA